MDIDEQPRELDTIVIAVALQTQLTSTLGRANSALRKE